MDSRNSDILFERRGAAGIIVLNRPQALNAVTHDMVRALARQLDAWASDAAVTRIIITAAGDRAFSAGGDIRALYELGRAWRASSAPGAGCPAIAAGPPMQWLPASRRITSARNALPI